MIRIITLFIPLLLISIHGFSQDLNTQLKACADPKDPQCQKTGMRLHKSSNTPNSGILNAGSDSNRMNHGMSRGRIHKGLSLQMAKPIFLGNCPKQPILKALKKSQKRG